MKCPHCVQAIHRAADVCPHCGFSMCAADARFGADRVHLRCLSDTAGILKKGDRELVESAMQKFGRIFPQLFVAVHTAPVGDVSDLRPYGFWFLNRAIFDDLAPEKSNQAGILLTLDPQSKAAAYAFGYLLDPYLGEEDTFECLSRAHAYWLEGRYAEGMVKSIFHLEEILVKRCRHAQRDPRYFRRKVFPNGAPAEPLRRSSAGQLMNQEEVGGDGL